MDIFNAYNEAIAISSIIILSYFFSYIAKKTNIPSVLLLIGLGIGLGWLLKSLHVDFGDYIMEALELFGIVGLIMIVLEAALDLELKKEKKQLLIRSFLVALFSLVATTFAIAYIFQSFLLPDFYTALLYAIPLSILSSAIIIPSVSHLLDNSKREFMIYESTFSDILGIMFFYFVLGSSESSRPSEVVLSVGGSVVLTVALSLLISYALVLLLQRLQSKVKLFFLIAILIWLYAVGKLFHLSSLLIIMVFGLVLNNYHLFFKGKLRGLIREDSIREITDDFHVVTMETAFVVRTFFFVIFGMTLDFSGITDLPSIYIASIVLIITYVIRYIFLKIWGGKTILPQLWIAPRGLITILLFFSIPAQFQTDEFKPTILLIVILASSFIMSGGLIAQKNETVEVDELSFDDWDELDREVESLTSSPEK